MKFHTLTALCAIASALIATAQVPSLINYQGRLTDANGNPVTGSKNFAISIYDAATNGTLLYTETIGAVTLDDNGVYSFQFGGTGTSNTLVTETVATTNGTATTFQKVLDNSPVVANSVSVTDGTYTWSQSAGSSNEDDFGVAYSTSLRRVTVNYYNGAPAAGRTITTTYRYGTSGITGALASGAEHWMAVSVDGTTQGTRQRVLAVPFASIAQSSLTAETADLALSAPSAELAARQSQEMAEVALFAAEKAKVGISGSSTANSFAEFFSDYNGFYNQVTTNGLFFDSNNPHIARVHTHSIPISTGASSGSGSSSMETITSNKSLRFIRLRTTSSSGSQYSPGASISGLITYSNGATQPYSLSRSYGHYSQGQSNTDYVKPQLVGVPVQNVTIQGSRTTALSQMEATIWFNEPRVVEISLPNGFVSNGSSYKILYSYSKIEESGDVSSMIVDDSGAARPINSLSWTEFSGSNSSGYQLKITYTPAATDSQDNQTHPEGVLILKK